MEVAGVLNTILKQQKEFQVEIRSEFRSMKDEFVKLEERQNGTDEKVDRIDTKVSGIELELDRRVTKVEGKIDILTSQTNNAVEVILGKFANMNEKLDKNIVVKYEIDFVTEKIQYMEKEIFKLKQQ